jgi:hypothetical protein
MILCVARLSLVPEWHERHCAAVSVPATAYVALDPVEAMDGT